MYWFYILKSKVNGSLYYGSTKDLRKRLEQHNAGKNRSTKKYIPWKIVYIEGYASEQDAREREQKIKQNGKVYTQLRKRIARSIGI